MSQLLAPPEVASGPEATAPAERRGLARDDVRMLVASPDGLVHTRLRLLPDQLRPGDAVVVNTSAVLPASLPAVPADGGQVRLHLGTPLPDGRWVVEVREPHGTGTLPRPIAEAQHLSLPGRASAQLVSPYGHVNAGGTARLWIAELGIAGDLHAYLTVHGSPIRYSDRPRTWPLEDYQTVFATEPGSAESPSAGRAFTAELVAELTARGVIVLPVVLHCGLSSPEAHEPPMPERFAVPAVTARHLAAARAGGGRVVAVGTTVVRALETAVDGAGRVRAASGWTDRIVSPAAAPRIVDGLLTGWHEPEASHLALLESVAGRELLLRSYDEAARAGYLWHEFGDLHLIWRAGPRLT
jgi:S-adenosylmethionine:tRNA ribosyltransferase-isomerase